MGVTWETHPADGARFEEFADVVNERRRRARRMVQHRPTHRDPRLAASRLIRPVDDVAVWSVICVVVRSGHRRRGVTGVLIEGAVAWAADQGAPAVEAYPVDAEGDRVDLTMAFVGTRTMCERAGFEVVGTTDAVAAGRPRLVMRRDLGAGLA